MTQTQHEPANREYLFCDGDLSATIRAHFEKIPQRVDSIPEEVLMEGDPEALRNEILGEFRINPLSLDIENKSNRAW